MSQEVEGVDFFTSDLIRRTRARKKRLEKELGQPSADEPSTDFVFDENLGQIVRKPAAAASSDVVEAAPEPQPKSPFKKQTPTKSVLSPNRTTAFSVSASIPFIDKSSTESLSPAASSGSSASGLPRYKVEIPSRLSPVKKTISRKFSPAVSSQTIAPKSIRNPPSTSSIANSVTEKPASPAHKSPKPILEKFEVMRKEAAKEMASEPSKTVPDVPVSSIRGRIQHLEHIFAQQVTEPAAPAPETLSLKHKKVLFEKKIREETGQKIAGIKRNEYLAQKRGRSESKLPAVSEGIVAKMQQKILAAQSSANESDHTAVRTEQGDADHREAAEPGSGKLRAGQEKVLNTGVDVAVKSEMSEFDRMNEESALASFFDIEKMDGDPADVEMELDHQNQYFSKPYAGKTLPPPSPDGTDSMSMCTQSSQSDKEFDSLPSSPAKSSSGSSKIYPDLPLEEERETFPSSPKKLRFCDEVVQEAVAEVGAAESQTSATTPLRTLSRYRLEQKQRQNATPQPIPKVVFGKTKSTLRSYDQLEEERKAELRRRVHVLKHEEVPRCEALTHQSIQALKACLVSDFRDTLSHADAERHVLVSTMKRAAALNEIHALNAQIAVPLLTESVGGHLTIQRLDLPIMRDAILAHKKGLNAKSPENQYYFCVVSCGPVVHSTECLPFSAGYSSGFLSFNLHSGFAFSNLRNSFQLRVEVYEVSLVKATKKESGRTIRLTPRKHPNPAPAAAEAKNEPLATSKGSVNVNVKNIKKKEFDLQNFRFESSLQGSIRIGMTVTAEYKNDYSNFLNFYDEKVDIGTWKRRWCHLKGPVIRFWRLPEDEEAQKKPLGEIDLRHCINPSIGPAPFDVCPRKESFVLVFAGTASDKTRLRVNWLVNKNYRDVIERNLVAADVLEERDEWISVLNDVLDGMRLWDEEALIPCSPADIQSYINV